MELVLGHIKGLKQLKYAARTSLMIQMMSLSESLSASASAATKPIQKQVRLHWSLA